MITALMRRSKFATIVIVIMTRKDEITLARNFLVFMHG